MPFKNKLLTLLEDILRRKNKRIRPPTAAQWHQLPPHIREWIIATTFNHQNGIDEDVYLCHWVR